MGINKIRSHGGELLYTLIKKMIPLILILIIAISQSNFATPNLQPKKILILHSDEEFIPANIDINKALVGRLKSSKEFAISIFSEYMDPPRFYDEVQMSLYKDNFIERYQNIKPDLIIAVDFKAFNFLTTTAKQLINDTPLVFCMVPEGIIDEQTLANNITGNYMNIDTSGTVDVIMHMHENTQQIVVISGAGPADKIKLKEVKNDLLSENISVPVIFNDDMTMKEMESFVSNLNDGSVVLYNAIFEDNAGEKFIPREALRSLNDVTSVPIYGIFYTNLDYGLVGGSLFEFDEVAYDTANKALSILSGVSPSNLVIEKVTNKVYMNWALFEKWNIDIKDIPENSIVLNQEFTVWELYRFEILGTFALIIVLTILLFYLSLQLQLKRKAQMELEQLNDNLEKIVGERTEALNNNNIELTHTNGQLNDEIVNRIAVEEELTATLDELSSTQQQLVAAEKQAVLHHLVRNLLHRVNTPLGTSLGYADLLRHQIESNIGRAPNDIQKDELEIVTNLLASQDKIKSTMDTLKAMLEVENEEAYHTVNLKQFVIDIITRNPVTDYENTAPVMLFCYPDLTLSLQTSSFKAAVENLIAYAKLSRKSIDGLEPAELSILYEDNVMELVYQDDALKHSKNIESIFDPYAFSAFKADPSGLELVILYNHITIGMQGDVQLTQVHDDEGVEHTVVKMTIPVNKK